MDSLCLLHLLIRLRESWRLQLTVGHVNHRLREAADRDQALVEDTCRRWGVPCRVAVLDPRSRPAGMSLEAWAREQRYEQLEALGDQVGADWITTAHQGNDQVETILMRLGSGAGIAGLKGIPPRRGRIVRPLLLFPRKDIETYVRREGIRFAEDASNRDLSHPRNFLRQKVIPVWEQSQPDLVAAFRQVSANLRDVETALDAVVKWLQATAVEIQASDRMELAAAELDPWPELLKVRLLQRLIRSEHPFRRHVWQQLKTFFQSASVGQWQALPGGWFLLKDRSAWILCRPETAVSGAVSVRTGDVTDCGSFYFRWNWVNSPGEFSDNPWLEIIDGAKVKRDPLVLRPWAPGDTFVPLGLQGRKKISDFLIDLKMDRFTKQRQLVLVAGEEIIWVCGQRISDVVKVTPTTRQFAELSIIPKVA
jgi:tRNA(Ile)-lysidine synthase